jgi:hypothetical protein
MLSAVPIKVIAKLQSHVARAFAYLVAKQRVLNQNTLPHFHLQFTLVIPSIIGSFYFTYARYRVSCFFSSNLHASLAFISSLVGIQLDLTYVI